MARAARSRAQAGFTLLEAIVALVVMATSLIALYAWLGTTTIGLQRAQSQLQSLEDARAAIALLGDLNPSAEANGERELGPLRVRWQSRPIDGPRPGLSVVGLPTQFDFTLFEVQVEVFRGERKVRDLSMRKTGWISSRPIVLEDL